MTTNIQKAISELGAELQSDGRYAYFDKWMGRWYLVSAADLESFASDYLTSDDERILSEAYSHWCAGTVPEEMPAGWEPEAKRV